MSKSKALVLLPVLLVLAGGGFYLWHSLRFIEHTDNAYVEADISQLSVKVPGLVVQSEVQDNQYVTAGTLLAKLDDSEFRARVLQSEARLASVGAELATLEAKLLLQASLIAQAKAGVQASEADVRRVQQQLTRATELRRRDYSSQDDVDRLTAEFDGAAARLAESRASLAAREQELGVLKAQREQLFAARAEANAGLELARLQLQDTEIRAPFNGIVGKRGAFVGQYVQPGQALFSLVPDGTVWITANFKETQIQAMVPGQPVAVSLDAFPDHDFHGVIDSLSPASGAKFSLLPAENATGNFTKIVQRIPVRIRLELPPGEQKVVPGLSAVVSVDTAATPELTVTAGR
ncbi:MULTISPECIES: HlyD family secretion protein [Shewanella]|uniref:HlyD family secretion protein n=1 Tax=Shewanella TaxID=22 RepID=UPI001C65D699|nr:MULTISPECIES: HlyD family secretion protein [Shewanella]QYJ75807.1 HlyD family secretion protein [Shewanella sp. FJAT-52076]QYK05671.1 HlyD family secretion protein [Shewanella zhangzhouensis]